MLFKLDENIPTSTIDLLRKHRHEGKTAHSQNLHGQADPKIVEECNVHGEILITCDTDFSDIRHYPPGSNPGILLLRLKRESAPATLAALERFFSSSPGDFARCTVIIEDSRWRIRRK